MQRRVSAQRSTLITPLQQRQAAKRYCLLWQLIDDPNALGLAKESLAKASHVRSMRTRARSSHSAASATGHKGAAANPVRC